MITSRRTALALIGGGLLVGLARRASARGGTPARPDITVYKSPT